MGLEISYFLAKNNIEVNQNSGPELMILCSFAFCQLNVSQVEI